MTQEQWTAVDRFIVEQLLPDDPALNNALRASITAGMPPINVSPNQGKLLYLLAATQMARAVLEIGTLGGYSTIWLARALRTDGQLVTLEIDPFYAEVARANIARADLSNVVDIRIGPALETLAQLPRDHPFDMVFIDADKEQLPEYFDWAVKLSRLGSLIVADNVVRDGEVINGASDDPKVRGVRRFYEMLADDQRVDATAIQTVGDKGYDGFVVARVIVDPSSFGR